MTQKTVSERIYEMKKIYYELERLNLGDQFDEIKAFHAICNDYVRSGNTVSGTIHLPFANRKIVYHFPSSAYQKCVACLRSDRPHSS